MTAMLATVTGTQEAEIAVAGGADIIGLMDPAAGVFGSLPLVRIEETLEAIGLRRSTIAAAGDPRADAGALADAAEKVAATGVDYVRVGLFPPEEKQLAAIRALTNTAAKSRLVASLFADHEGDLLRLVAAVAAAGFSGVMHDTADKSGGRLLAHAGIPALSAFVKAAKQHRLFVGLAGGLEAPDVPRLLSLKPDFIGFRRALCVAGRRDAGLDPQAVAMIRTLMSVEHPGPAGEIGRPRISARAYPSAASDTSQGARVFVRDLVLAISIGAYSRERNAPQKVRFDVSVHVRRTPGDALGMGNVYSYDLITDTIARIVAEGHIDFVETLADRIGTELLSDPRAVRVTVKVEKLEVGPGGVGVEISMERPDQAAVEDRVPARLDQDVRQPH